MKVYAQDVGTIDVNVPDLGEIAAGLVMLAFVAAGLFFLVQVIIGGISWIGAGGDPKALEAARSRITNAVIGLLIVVAAFAIAIIFTTILGFGDIFTSPITIN